MTRAPASCRDFSRPMVRRMVRARPGESPATIAGAVWAACCEHGMTPGQCAEAASYAKHYARRVRGRASR